MKFSLLAATLVVMATVASASAVITGFTFAPDSDGAICCPITPSPTWNGAVGSAVADGIQKGSVAHLLGNVTTNDEFDPTITSTQNILNDTGFTWNAYIVNVYMKKDFTLLSATGPANWSVTPVATATGSFLDGDGNSWSRKATVNYASLGSAYDIPVNSSGTFGVTFGFLGAANYAIELIAVPEPMTMALVALGGLFLVRRR